MLGHTVDAVQKSSYVLNVMQLIVLRRQSHSDDWTSMILIAQNFMENMMALLQTRWFHF